MLFLLRQSLQKSLRLRRFKSDRDEIWQECSSSKCASTGRVGFLIWCNTFKIVSAMLTYTVNYLVSQHESSSWWLCSSIIDSSWSIVHSYLLWSSSVFNVYLRHPRLLMQQWLWCMCLDMSPTDYRVSNESLLIGGEVCLWTEFADDDSIMPRLWLEYSPFGFHNKLISNVHL